MNGKIINKDSQTRFKSNFGTGHVKIDIDHNKISNSNETNCKSWLRYQVGLKAKLKHVQFSMLVTILRAPFSLKYNFITLSTLHVI